METDINKSLLCDVVSYDLVLPFQFCDCLSVSLILEFISLQREGIIRPLEE